MTNGRLPGVSVIITAYNYGRYLAQAVTSVLDQTAPPEEVIVVDDGSTDDTSAVARGFGERVRLWQQANRGPGAARNAGLRLARGEFIAMLDADDYWPPDRLARQHAALEADPDLAVVFGLVTQFVSPEVPPEAAARLAVPASPVVGRVPGAMLARRAVFDTAGLFHEIAGLGDNVEWVARVHDLGLRTRVLPHVALYRRRHTSNLSQRHRDNYSAYVHVLKASLDRRRKLNG